MVSAYGRLSGDYYQKVVFICMIFFYVFNFLASGSQLMNGVKFVCCLLRPQ